MSDNEKQATEDVEGHWGTGFNANEAVDGDLETEADEAEEVKGGATVTGKTATM